MKRSKFTEPQIVFAIKQTRAVTSLQVGCTIGRASVPLQWEAEIG
jgi:hypothetical protein